MKSQLDKIKELLDTLSKEIPDFRIHGLTLDCGSIEYENQYLKSQMIPKYHIVMRDDMKDDYVFINGEGICGGYITINDLIEFLKEEAT